MGEIVLDKNNRCVGYTNLNNCGYSLSNINKPSVIKNNKSYLIEAIEKNLSYETILSIFANELLQNDVDSELYKYINKESELLNG